MGSKPAMVGLGVNGKSAHHVWFLQFVDEPDEPDDGRDDARRQQRVTHDPQKPAGGGRRVHTSLWVVDTGGPWGQTSAPALLKSLDAVNGLSWDNPRSFARMCTCADAVCPHWKPLPADIS